MPFRIPTFIRVLDAECDDLLLDIEDMITRCKTRLDNHELTERVFRENAAFLSNEMHVMQEFKRFLGRFDPSQYVSFEGFLDALRAETHQYVDREGHCPCLKSMLERKFSKVERYLTAPEN